MKKVIFSLVILTMCSAAVFSQIKVSNGFGQTLKVTINEQTATIPNNGVQAFSVTGTGSAVLIKCETPDGSIKFSVPKAVPASNLIIISPNDGQQNSQASRIPSGQIALIYKGTTPFKIFSSVGQGLEFSSTDTVNYVSAPKNSDLVIGIGLKQGENQAIWPYAEIRKRLLAGSTACKITDADIKKMSTGGTTGKGQMKKLKIRLTAKDYKIYFEPSSGEPISLSFNRASRSIEVPIGQFYIKISYTDPSGMFHSTVFVPKHVTADDTHLDISEENLKNAITLNW